MKKIIILLLIIIIFFQVKPVFAQALFQDDFNDGNADGWTPISGTWGVTSGEYVQTSYSSTSDYNYSVAGSVSWSNYVLSAKVKKTAGYGAGILFRVVDNNHFYEIRFDCGDGKIYLDKDWWYNKLTYTYFTCSNNVYYNLTVVADGGRIRAYVNSTLYIDYYDKSYSNGGIGLSTQYAKAAFDDIEVDNITNPALPPQINWVNNDFNYKQFDAISVGTRSCFSLNDVISGADDIPEGAKNVPDISSWEISILRNGVEDKTNWEIVSSGMACRDDVSYPITYTFTAKINPVVRVSADYGNLLGVSNLTYGADVTTTGDLLDVKNNSTLLKRMNDLKLSMAVFEYQAYEACDVWDSENNTCSQENVNFEDWNINRNPDNGEIKSWIETSNVKSGNKAFHFYENATDPTEISFSYYTDLIEIDENKYYEAGLWSFPIQGVRSTDISLDFYDANGNFLERRWGRDSLGSFSNNIWSRYSILWYPSSLGQGNGYIEKGAKYAKLVIYIVWHSSGVREAIDDDVFFRKFDSLPTSQQRQSETSNLILDPSFEGYSYLGYDWSRFDKMIEAIRGIGAEPIVTIPIGTWGNENFLPSNFPLNYSYYIESKGYFPAADAYCEYVKAIVNHTVEKGYNVRYYEIGNEVPVVCDDNISKAYMNLFETAWSCMSLVNPNVLLSHDRSNYKGFFDNYFVYSHAGFLDLHYYETGGTCMYPSNPSNINNSFYPPDDANGWLKDSTLMKNIGITGTSCTECGCRYSPSELKKIWKQKTGNDIEVIPTEINLNAAWRNGTDPRQTSIFGAAWFAAKAKAFLLNNTDSLQFFVLSSWDSTSPLVPYGGLGFGMMNSSYPYNPYPPFWTNYLLSNYIPNGSFIYNSTSSESDVIDQLAVDVQTSKNVLLINKMNVSVNLGLSFLGFPLKDANLYVLDSASYIANPEQALRNVSLPKNNFQNITLDGYSVALLQSSFEPNAPYITYMTGNLTSAFWDSSARKYLSEIECLGDGTATFHSDYTPSILKINGDNITYDETLSTIPSWKYDSTNKIITVKFSC